MVFSKTSCCHSVVQQSQNVPRRKQKAKVNEAPALAFVSNLKAKINASRLNAKNHRCLQTGLRSASETVGVCMGGQYDEHEGVPQHVCIIIITGASLQPHSVDMHGLVLFPDLCEVYASPQVSVDYHRQLTMNTDCVCHSLIKILKLTRTAHRLSAL